MKSFPGGRELLCRTNDTIEGMPKLVPGNAMDRYETIRFEGVELMVTSSWHDVLVSSYGPGYMTPRKIRDDEGHRAFMEAEERNAEQEFALGMGKEPEHADAGRV